MGKRRREGPIDRNLLEMIERVPDVLANFFIDEGERRERARRATGDVQRRLGDLAEFCAATAETMRLAAPRLAAEMQVTPEWYEGRAGEWLAHELWSHPGWTEEKRLASFMQTLAVEFERIGYRRGIEAAAELIEDAFLQEEERAT